jgi:hypothetical protein
MKTPSQFPHVVCWDAESRQEVTNSVALRVRESIFHATHFPIPIRRLNLGIDPPTSAPYSENEFLSDFLQPRATHLFCLAVGDTGTGKSHLIRWLWRQIERRREARWRVVHVPRSAANLADMLKCILADDFRGEEIDKIRQELQRTVKMTVNAARDRVLDELAFVLRAENLQAARLDGRTHLQFPQDTDHAEIILPLLPSMLRDAAIRKHLSSDESGIISRLARHVMGERQSRDDAHNLKWAPTDLLVPLRVSIKAGEEARSLAETLLSDERQRTLTSDVLNRVSSDALASLVGLKQGNLREAMRSIRRQLRAREQQLLLLIEDLSVSQGVDRELVEALLPEESAEDLCVLRSVVGLTHEDLAHMLANVRGRVDIATAFNVPIAEGGVDGVNDKDIADFVSRYLNAARYSLEDLDVWQTTSTSEAELATFCEVSGCPNRAECHGVFGEVNGRGLYPFNLVSLARLYRNLHGEGRTAFNPRLLVRRVIDEMLQRGEAQIPTHMFPGPDLLDWFSLAEVGATVQVRLDERYRATQARRIRTALEIYASSPNGGKLPRGVADKFELGGETVLDEVTTPEPRVTRERQPENRVASTPDSFDIWLNQRQLDDTELNKWRRAVYDAIYGALEWDSEPLGPLFRERFGRKFIHFEGQNPGMPGDVKLLIKAIPEHAEAMRALMSATPTRDGLLLARGHIERWTEDICRQIRKVAHVTGQLQPLSTAVHLLATGALLRDVVPEGGGRQAFLEALFMDWPAIASAAKGRSVPWTQLWEAFAKWAPKVRESLLRQIGSSKGGQVGAGMIDVALILDDVDSVSRRVRIDFDEDFGKDWDGQTYGPLIELARRVAKHLAPAIEQETTFCRQWLMLVQAACGEHSTRELGVQLKSALQAGISAAVFQSPIVPELVARCESFVGGAVEQLVRTGRALTAEPSRNELLRLLGRVDRAAMSEATDSLGRIEKELSNANSYLDQKLGAQTGEDLEQLKIAIRLGLGELRQQLRTLTDD